MIKLKAVQFQTDIAFLGTLTEKTIGPDKAHQYSLTSDHRFVYVTVLKGNGTGREFSVPMTAVNWIECESEAPKAAKVK